MRLRPLFLIDGSLQKVIELHESLKSTDFSRNTSEMNPITERRFCQHVFAGQGYDKSRLTGKKVNGLIRVSVLRNYPVICDHRQIGLMQGVSLNEAQNQVRALIVSCGIRGKRLVFPDDVAAFGDGFILIRKANRYVRSYEAPPSTFVRDTTGLLCGRVTDYAMNESTLEIQAVEMIPGYTGRERKCRIWVYTYVPAEHCASELSTCLYRQ